VPPRSKTEKAETNNHFSVLSDVVAHDDIMSIYRTGDEPPDLSNKRMLAGLHASLQEISREPDIKSSFQYLAHKTEVVEADGSGTWQVQISRRRRRQVERMSRDHHDADDDSTGSQELIDEHGNEILPLTDAVRRVATIKELKRIKKAVASRRRAGEDVYTEDELDAANLELAPEIAAKPKRSREKINGGKKGAPSGPTSVLTLSSLPPKSEWDLMYLEPPAGGSSPVKSFDSSEHWSNGSWMFAGGGTVVARVPSGSWS